SHRLANLIAYERGSPVYDDLLATGAEEESLIRGRGSLLKHASSKTVRKHGMTFMHDDSPSIELTMDECKKAAQIIIDAQNLYLSEDGIGQVLPTENEWAVGFAMVHRDFIPAFKAKDDSTLMRIGFES